MGLETPLVLEGERVRLESITEDHLAPLWEVAQDPSIWKWIPQPVTSLEQLRTVFERRAQGLIFPFAIFDRASRRYAGSSSYLNIEQYHRRVEIGYTWLSPSWQRTHVNTEAKLLLLGHAFERLGCVRVEFKTDALNAKSRAALKRIGATEEGCLRRHMRTHDERFRDSVYFSILDSEWPEKKAALVRKLTPPAGR